MIGFFVEVIIACMVTGLLLWAIANLPFIPAPMGQMLRVVIVVVACLWLINALLLAPAGGVDGLRKRYRAVDVTR
jgi:hypothetical protein